MVQLNLTEDYTPGFSKIQTYIEYKANLEGIPVVYVNPKNTKEMS